MTPLTDAEYANLSVLLNAGLEKLSAAGQGVQAARAVVAILDKMRPEHGNGQAEPQLTEQDSGQ